MNTHNMFLWRNKKNIVWISPLVGAIFVFHSNVIYTAYVFEVE